MGIFGANVPLLVDLNLLGETVLAILMVTALLLAAAHKGHIHHYLMLTVFTVDLLVFKPIMFSLAFNGSNGLQFVAAVLVGGLSVAAHSAMPGDPLWGVSKTIFSDRAGEVELVNDLSEYLAAADDAARSGDRGEAERLLEEVSQRLDEVGDASERVELMKRRDAIRRDLSRVTPSAVRRTTLRPRRDSPHSNPAPTSGTRIVLTRR